MHLYLCLVSSSRLLYIHVTRTCTKRTHACTGSTSIINTNGRLVTELQYPNTCTAANDTNTRDHRTSQINTTGSMVKHIDPPVHQCTQSVPQIQSQYTTDALKYQQNATQRSFMQFTTTCTKYKSWLVSPSNISSVVLTNNREQSPQSKTYTT